MFCILSKGVIILPFDVANKHDTMGGVGVRTRLAGQEGYYDNRRYTLVNSRGR